MAIYHSLEFDGVNSLNNGVYITGEAVYNAPERAVEMISIAGRNGAFVLDKGRYENVSVRYPAGAYDIDQEGFSKKMRAFRNLMATKVGYKRLVDTYNPDEYRLAVFKDAIEVEAVNGGRAGEFELLFDCQPQRFLMSGEAELPVTNGETIYNPTPNDASPLLEVEGYGKIDLNGYEIELNDDVFGDIALLSRAKRSVVGNQTNSIVSTFDPAYVSVGDTIRLASESMSTSDGYYDGSMSSYFHINCSPSYSFGTPTKQESNLVYSDIVGYYYEPNKMLGTAFLNPVTFTVGTGGVVTGALTAEVPIISNGSTVETITVTNTLVLDYDEEASSITVGSDVRISGDTLGVVQVRPSDLTIARSAAIAHSTESVLGHPTYLDCDLGVAYRNIGGGKMLLNGYIDLGADLPILKAGNNEITFDNTITSLKITPRWWVL